MNDETLLQIAASWSFWQRPIPASVPRRVTLPDALRDTLALVIQGVRRGGKSTLLTQIVDRYALPAERCLFVNFEDPRLTGGLHHETLEALTRGFRARHPTAPRLAFFFDEIQGVEGWERWIRSQLDRPQGHLFVLTGSNSTLLSGELGSVLTGRHLTVELYPFDLHEARAVLPTLSLEQYLQSGGFPEPLSMASERDADMLLRQYFHDIVERDVRERVGARSSQPIRQFVQMAFDSAGSELSLRRIAASIGVAVETAASYQHACESAYLLSSVPFFCHSERKRAVRPRKLYPVDTGLRRVVAAPGSPDRGQSLECATLLALRRRGADVSYWRDAAEVDFVIRDGRRIIPVQVSWDGPKPRHERALQAFYEAFPHADEAVFVTAEDFERSGPHLPHVGPA